MARTVKEVRLQDRTARTKLAPRRKPYWRFLSEGRHLGYYRGARSSSWIARYRGAAAQDEYVTAKLGAADDRCDADGEAVLDWKQAFEKALAWFDAQSRRHLRTEPIWTVKQAVDFYVAMRDARDSARAGRPMRSTASSRLRIHVLETPTLPSICLDQLSESDIKAWLAKVTIRKDTTKRRLAADLKAALNAAYAEDRRRLPADLPEIIKYGLKVEVAEDLAALSVARENQILGDEQVRLIIETAMRLDAEGDLTRRIVLLAATGARFSQVQRMLVRDVQFEHSRLLLPKSRKGKGKTADYIRVQVGPDVLNALRPVVEGRKPAEPLLEHWRYVRDGIQWIRDRRGPWEAAWEMTNGWREIAGAAGLPRAIPYALRHSSIVRGIRLGLPIRLVAALHDTSVVMIERHYSRWITEGLDELAARAVVPLVRSEAEQAAHEAQSSTGLAA